MVTIRNLILLIVFLFSGTPFSFSQSDFQNLQKYWHYRYRLTHYFMVIGEGAGESLPADIRNLYNGGTLDWAETPVQLGHYIGVLATEYHLLKQSNQNTDQTLTELYYALKAVERLDNNGEVQWGFPPSTNGFLMRDDVPVDFITSHSATADLNLDLLPPVWPSSGSSPGNGKPGFVNNVNSAFISHNGKSSASQDMLYNLLMGLALTKHFVENESIPFQNTINADSVTYNFNEYVRNEAENIVNYIKTSPFSSQASWILEEPDGDSISVNDGGDASAVSFGLAKAGSFFTGADYQNTASMQYESLWQHFRIDENIRYRFSQILPLILASIGDSWGEYTDTLWVNKTREGILFHSDYNAGPQGLNLWQANHYGMELYYGAIHRLLHGYYWWESPGLALCNMQSILNQAPWDGPYYHSTLDKDPNNWACSRRFYNSPPAQPDGKPGFEGNYNGLDYMLLHNLYLCLQVTGTEADSIFNSNNCVATFSENQQLINSTLSVFPNPGNGNYFVRLSGEIPVTGLYIEVYNMFGDIIMYRKMERNFTEIDLRNKPNGIYFVRIKLPKQSLNQRIIKQE